MTLESLKKEAKTYLEKRAYFRLDESAQIGEKIMRDFVDEFIGRAYQEGWKDSREVNDEKQIHREATLAERARCAEIVRKYKKIANEVADGQNAEFIKIIASAIENQSV